MNKCQMKFSNQSSKAALFANNKVQLSFSMAGVFFKVLAGLGFSGFTQRVLDTIAGESKYSFIGLLVTQSYVWRFW